MSMLPSHDRKGVTSLLSTTRAKTVPPNGSGANWEAGFLCQQVLKTLDVEQPETSGGQLFGAGQPLADGRAKHGVFHQVVCHRHPACLLPYFFRKPSQSRPHYLPNAGCRRVLRTSGTPLSVVGQVGNLRGVFSRRHVPDLSRQTFASEPSPLVNTSARALKARICCFSPTLQGGHS